MGMSGCGWVWVGVGGCWKLRESEGGTMSCRHDSFFVFVFCFNIFAAKPCTAGYTNSYEANTSVYPEN